MGTKTGILLMAYGTPRTLDEVEPYFRDIRGGRSPSPEAVAELTERYEQVGGKTPLLEITQDVADKLQERLNRGGGEYQAYIGMKHWHPYIADTLSAIVDDGIDELVAITLAPHYSKMSIDGYRERLLKAMEPLDTPIPTRFVESWYEVPAFVSMMAARVRDALDKFETPLSDVEVVFSAHSLPSRILEWNDPYPTELRESAQLVANEVCLAGWRFSYQSAGQTGTPWLGPDILETVSEIAGEGKRGTLVVPIGFVCDHLEILFDIDIEAQELAGKLNIELRRTEMPNATAEFIEALASLVLDGDGARTVDLASAAAS
jgi:ferrochelatase